ncbi:MAG TPA: BON domain-containing protein [Blastocatellia bacterium]|nr:BON domain-containing protein [Blastocatellia bacterium]
MSARVQTKTDNNLRESVLSQFEWEPEITSKEIGVTAQDGVVGLTGFVDSFPERLAAEKAAKRVYGVKAVANDIKVRLPYECTDVEIANNAIHAISSNVSVPDDRIKVTVRDGWVALEGTVDWRFQKQIAEEAVRFLGGVRGISNEIEVMPEAKPELSTEQIRTRIEEALRRSAEVDSRRIRVEISDNTVRLYGNVSSWVEKEEAARAAGAAPGVARVENHITVTL